MKKNVMAIKSICGLWIMGEVEDNDHVKMQRVKNPAIFRYEKHPSLGGSSVKFQKFDPVMDPDEIRVRASVLMKVADDIIEKYNKFWEESHE